MGEGVSAAAVAPLTLEGHHIEKKVLSLNSQYSIRMKMVEVTQSQFFVVIYLSNSSLLDLFILFNSIAQTYGGRRGNLYCC